MKTNRLSVGKMEVSGFIAPADQDRELAPRGRDPGDLFETRGGRPGFERKPLVRRHVIRRIISDDHVVGLPTCEQPSLEHQAALQGCGAYSAQNTLNPPRRARR